MSVSLQADSTLPVAYLKVNGSTSATLSTSGIAPAWVVKTSAYTATNADHILADTSASAWTLTLPASPASGAQVVIGDIAGTWATNALTVLRNGSTIQGLSEDLICDKANKRITLYFNGTTWRVLA